MHSHHATQIALSAGLPIRFRVDPGSWRDYDGVLITPNLRHAFDGASQVVAHVFVEPESREGRAILERLDTTGIVPTDDADLAAARSFVFEPWASRANAATTVSLQLGRFGVLQPTASGCRFDRRRLSARCRDRPDQCPSAMMRPPRWTNRCRCTVPQPRLSAGSALVSTGQGRIAMMPFRGRRGGRGSCR